LNSLIYLSIGLIGLIPLSLLFYFAFILFYKKSGYIWFVPYLKHYRERKKWQTELKKSLPEKTRHIIFTFVDHFEPFNEKANNGEARDRVKFWVYEYPKLVDGHVDADGKPPQHTWFYPCEQDLSFLSDLAALAFRGLGEVEFHLHHHNDTSERLAHKLERSKREFSKRGATITAEQKPKNHFAFIHGNWALGNSHPKGLWCGVNDEITILQNTGCFADFTLPSAPHPTQTRKLNSIYYAKDIPDRPKSHDTGTDARVGFRNRKDFLLVQGPLMLYRSPQPQRWLPIIDTGEVAQENPATPQRVDAWIRANIHVQGRPEWIFVKIHTHGANPRNRDALFGRQMQEMFAYLEKQYNDGEKYKLHYATAREVYNIIKAAEDGKDGDPGIYRDYIIPPYANTRIRANVLFELKSYSKTWLDIENLQPARKCLFMIKKGQLEKIEGLITEFKLTRDIEHRRLILEISGKNWIFFNIRTSRPIKKVENGTLMRSRKMRGFFITSIKAFLKPNVKIEIFILW